jgi:Ca2+/H+ antiporter
VADTADARKDRFLNTELEERLETMHAALPFFHQLAIILFPRWLTFNWLLVASPVGIGFFTMQTMATPTVILNLLPIIPLTMLIIFATDQLRLRLGLILGSFIVVTAR